MPSSQQGCTARLAEKLPIVASRRSFPVVGVSGGQHRCEVDCLHCSGSRAAGRLLFCRPLNLSATSRDIVLATLHDLKALAGHPQWVRLNYSSKKEKEAEDGVDRDWCLGKPGCEGEAPSEKSCDEYPFFATAQGGPLADPAPSLEWINASDNSRQGGKYGNFITACKMAERGSTDYAFLAIPLPPSLEIPTTRLCN
jgi:hypothetical protein